MPHSIKDTARDALGHGRRLRGRNQLRRAHVDGATAAAVLRALTTATTDSPDPQESAWVARIEATRRRLAASREPLTVTDYGAGRRGDLTRLAVATGTLTTPTLGEMTRSSKPPRWAYLLFRLIRELQPRTGLELGACVGISASYQSAAMDLNGHGRLVSLEGADILAERSRLTLDELGLSHRAEVRLGTFTDTLDAALAELSPLEWAFIDGHHDGPATLMYAERILASVAPEAVLVFDDINWSSGMRDAWQEVVADERYSLTVDLRGVGLAVVSAEGRSRQRLSISYY